MDSRGDGVVLLFIALVLLFIAVLLGADLDDTKQREDDTPPPVVSICGQPVTDAQITTCYTEVTTNG